MNFKSIIFFIITISTVLFPTEFYKLSELEHNGAKQDSGTVWVANPIPDVRLGPSETKTIDITDVFTTNPDTVAFSFDPFPISSNNSIVTGNLTYNESTGKIYLDLISKTVFGSAQVSVKVNTEFGSASDTLTVKVDDPASEFIEWGTAYSFDPSNSFGNGVEEWTAAINFSLGSTIYELREIEFGYAWDGVVEWKIVPFETVPVDTGFAYYSGTKSFKGGNATYIENLTDTLTGSIAVVFKTTANFMSMDPAGNSDQTWIYPVGEDSLWVHPEDISADYAGAWYIRLLVKNTSGIEETISSEKSFDLIMNYPNPFNGATLISWTMREPGNAQISVYNSKGEFVKSLISKNFGRGSHSVTFDASGINSGVYYYELQIDGIRAGSNRMLYLK